MLWLTLLPLISGYAIYSLFFEDDEPSESANETPDEETVETIYGNETGQWITRLFAEHDIEAFLGEGGDQIQTGSGNDTIIDAGGNNLLLPRAGNNYVEAGDGNDAIYASNGDDTLLGGGGDDDIRGGAGADLLIGGRGDDTVSGGDGDDTLTSAYGLDYLSGDDGNDVISSVEAFSTSLGDTVDGGDGDDLLRGDQNDILTGGADADSFQVEVDGDRISATEFGPVLITDLDPATETIQIELATGDTGTITQGTDPDTGDAVVFVDGTVVAVLQGVTPAQMGWTA
ncbi:MAG: calcium-binding protein [Thalassovita sp.]